MNAATEFLATMAQAVSKMNLYSEGHPSREEAIDICHRKLSELQDRELSPVFTFLRGEILHGGHPIRELRNWNWGVRLSAVGVQRLEFLDRVSRDDLEAFFEEVLGLVSGLASGEVRQERPTNIRYGDVGLADEEDGDDDVQDTAGPLGYSLAEEISGVKWLHSELKEHRRLHPLEAEGIVRSLSVAMHADQGFLIPQVRLEEFDQYTVTHSLNVSVLTMALAESLGLSPKEVRMFGIAGLLHDLGNVTIPEDVLTKPGKLAEEERDLIRTHPVEGARIILETKGHLDLAAVVAYEHHMRVDGRAYPVRTFKRKSHQASNLVQVCDVFDALCTDRPFRPAYSRPRALQIIEKRAGTHFDKEIAKAFLRMMAQRGDDIREVRMADPTIPPPPPPRPARP